MTQNLPHMLRSSIMQTYNELSAVRNPVTGLQICYEFVSAYRRVIVLKDESGFILRVSYKGIAASLKTWEKRYGVKEDALAWAKVQAANNNIVVSFCLTVKDYKGVQNI